MSGYLYIINKYDNRYAKKSPRRLASKLKAEIPKRCYIYHIGATEDIKYRPPGLVV